MKRNSNYNCSPLLEYPLSYKYQRLSDVYSVSNKPSPSKSCGRSDSMRCRVVSSHRCKTDTSCCPDTLVDISAKVAAAKIPFGLVEERYPHVPAPVVRKLITWSFPRSEADIRRYSALSCESAEGNGNSPQFEAMVQTRMPQCGLGVEANLCSDGLSDVTFNKGVALANSEAIQQPMQIGFHLSGIVNEKVNQPIGQVQGRFQSNSTNCSYNVAVTFDRCKVTSSTCNCQFGDGIFFCRHIVAMLVYRMRNSESVKIRVPISDSLQQLNRDQLQKLTQYLLARHAHVLPTAQEIADGFCDPTSDINVVHGAPDPTAGAGFHDDDRWNLDDNHVSDHIRHLLRHSNKQSSSEQLRNIMKKIREMMKVRDCNGARLLTLVTKELLQQGFEMRSNRSNHICSQLWDEIGLLWICVVLNPNEKGNKDNVLEQLREWSDDPHCPPEDDVTDFAASSRRTVFSRAINAGSLSWDDQHLMVILRRRNGEDEFTRHIASSDGMSGSPVGGFANFNSMGQALWNEQTPIACARVEALRSHGYAAEAMKLAIAVARTIREKHVGEFKLYKECGEQQGRARIGCVGLVGHSLNPINTLYETLTDTYDVVDEEKLNREDKCARESLRREAFEVCLLVMGEQRCMPTSSRAQEKILSCEKQLIENIKKHSLDEELVDSLREITMLLLEGGPKSGLGKHLHRESLPCHSFATYLFNALLPYDRKLAFKVGLRAMRMPIWEATEAESVDEAERNIEDDDATRAQQVDQHGVDEQPVDFRRATFNYQFSYPSNWSIISDLEARQYDLAATLLQTANGDVMLSRSIVEGIQRHMRNSSHVFQLSHDAFKCATSQPGATSPESTMLNVAMQLSMQVLQMTIQGGSWRRTEMVGWLVTCATEIGLCALLSTVKTWYTLFTPVEACTMVAGCVSSPNTAMRLNLDPRQREKLRHSICNMAVQCAVKDPQSCALRSLNLCETYKPAFDSIYRVIIEASNKRRIDSSQLFATARYLDQRGFHDRAFAVAFGAAQQLRVSFNHDAHPSSSDLLWTTQLAQSLGMQELEDLVNIIVGKVECASMLSDVLRTCTSNISGRIPNCIGNFGNRGLRADLPPLRPLLEASISAFISTIHSKLSHISPRHYTEFIDFLIKARETFLMAPDGHAQFSQLLANLKMIYKGKKKLLNLVTLRFG